MQNVVLLVIYALYVRNYFVVLVCLCDITMVDFLNCQIFHCLLAFQDQLQENVLINTIPKIWTTISPCLLQKPQNQIYPKFDYFNSGDFLQSVTHIHSIHNKTFKLFNHKIKCHIILNSILFYYILQNINANCISHFN